MLISRIVRKWKRWLQLPWKIVEVCFDFLLDDRILIHQCYAPVVCSCLSWESQPNLTYYILRWNKLRSLPWFSFRPPLSPYVNLTSLPSDFSLTQINRLPSEWTSEKLPLARTVHSNITLALRLLWHSRRFGSSWHSNHDIAFHRSIRFSNALGGPCYWQWKGLVG